MDACRFPAVVRLRRFVQHTRGFMAAGNSTTGRVRILLVTVWLLARDKARWLPPPPIGLRAERHGRTVRFRLGDYQDLEVMRELYVEDEYDVPLPDTADVVVDLGANVGLSALDFRARYPTARIFAVEPDPLAFAKLERNVKADPRIEAVNVAVGGEDGERDFFSSHESVVSGFERTRDFQKPIQVRARTLDTLLADLGISHVDVLKVDVEGAERELFDGFTGLSRVGCIVGELHLDAIGQTPEEFYAAHFDGFDVTTHLRLPHRSTFTAVRRS